MHILEVTILLLSLVSLRTVYAGLLSRDTGKTTLTISTKVNTTGVGNIVARDQARVQSLMNASLLSTGNGSVSISSSVILTTVEVGIGTPPTYYTLLIDTGSSNTWVGASKPYVPTNSSVNTNNSVLVNYGGGGFDGEEWLDNVTFTPDLVVSQQSIGVASFAEGFSGVDGILGLGPVDLTQNTVNNTLEVPTVLDNLYAEKTISQEVFGICYVPTSENDGGGTLTLGGSDDSVMTSAVNYVPLTTSDPAATYWGIDQSISYGNTTIMASTSGIVDTGTTFILIASDAFQQYETLTGATLDPTTGLLMITSAQYANLQTLWFNIGGTLYGLTPNGQIWPRSLNTAIGGNASAIYLVLVNFGQYVNPGFNFVNGYSFLQRFCTVYDATNQRFGIAQTAYTNATTN